MNSIGDRPPRRTQAPEFTLPAADGQPVSSRDYRGRNLVVAFYPADWSPVCTSELALIQETLNDLHGRNAEVLGISVDNCFSHRAWTRVQHLGFPLLADFWPHGAVARRYGVFRDSDGMARRSLFFIDTGGELRDGWVAANQSIAPGLNIIFDTLDRMGQAGMGGQQAVRFTRINGRRRVARPVLEGVLASHPTTFRLVYGHFPVTTIHPHAERAAEAAEAAGAQGRFWEMHDAIFAHREHLAFENLRRYANSIGLNLARFDRDMTTIRYLGESRRTSAAASWTA
jgi:peroxiredoxin